MSIEYQISTPYLILVKVKLRNTYLITNYVENPLFSIGLSSSCADQFCSLCSPMQRLLLYMYLSQLMSTFTNYLKVHHSLNVTSSSDPDEPVIQHLGHMYLLIHLCPKIRLHTGYHFPVISFPHWHLSSVLFSPLASFQ